ncbi:MAG: hypothetical protein ABFD92_00810 [Planctomycetaceae bacterium]|nr:hypothetical protein [Planctomycetaceae bacterium]
MATMEHRDPVYAPGDYRSLPRRSAWGAIFAGAVIAISVQLLLAVLGAAIGISVFGTTEGEVARTIGIGAIIWWVIATLASLFCGGLVAAKLAGTRRPFEGTLHGAVTWGVATLASALLLGTLVGGAWTMLATTEEPALQRDAMPGVTASPNLQQYLGPTAGAAWGLFFMLLLGLAAAIVGGIVGSRLIPYDAPEPTTRMGPS